MRNRSPEPTRTLSIWKDKVKVIYRRDAETAEKFFPSFSRFSRVIFSFVIPTLSLPKGRDLQFAAKCRFDAWLSITIYKNCRFYIILTSL